ncbi:MAG: electron transfer flavoprotein-ubiquinone oxidoreductase [Rhizobiales bacterium]|nr:electron transfer flavoprotein-ubiquinone oxidoreductase [Hyphomicrobiales bacterium]
MEELAERESMDVDVVIVGAGPAGLATAIRLKQLAAENDREISVTVLEKGSEVGAHILSGAVIDPVGLDALLPDWRELDPPAMTPVTDDQFVVLGPAGAVRLPTFLFPPFMSNHGCFAASLGNVCRWLGGIAEGMGVEIYPGFAAGEVLYNDDGAVVGVATGDMGIARDGSHKDGFMRGMELRASYTILAEGARGHLSKQVIAKFSLDAGREPQKFGLGIKELWEVDPAKHRPGLVQHTMGWPLDRKTGGGSFLYHLDDNQVAVGFVVHLNYQNPTLSPFEEFQRFKTHPAIRPTFEGGKRLAYGARAITEGGFQSVPELVFPGGALAGCAAGFVNVPRIKGSHNAVLTGKMAGEAAFAALAEGRSHDELAHYQAAYEASGVAAELKRVRNVKPLWSRFGTYLGIALGGLDMWMRQLKVGLPFTLGHGKPDHAALKPVSAVKAIEYPRPDGEVSFDRLSSVFLSGTNHEEDQPVHLQVAEMNLQLTGELGTFGGPSAHYCPAGVYEWVEDDAAGVPRFQINAQNCVHCKTCDIKDPNQNINWVTPEGGGGPTYPNM